MKLAILILFAYLLGSISFSFILTRMLMKEDIRKLGSGNAGATNTLRVLGKGPAIIVLLFDVAKGVLAVFAADYLGFGTIIALLAGIAAVAGHNWPIFHGFKGGKGVATTIGVFAAISFLPSLAAGVIIIGIIWVTKYVSLGSIFFMILTPIFMLVAGFTTESAAIAFILSLLSIWRHRSNIQRLFHGNERKLGQ